MMDNTTASIPGVVISINDDTVPGDYRQLSPWFNIVRRMRLAASVGSYAVITMHVVVDETGRPTHNTEPKVTRLEPKARGEALEDLLRTLAGE